MTILDLDKQGES